MEGVGQLLIDGNNKLKSSFKSSDKTGTSAAEIMTETATGISHCNFQGVIITPLVGLI